ncbi:MAG: monovalent cation/H+ antiporter complex subunit F [Lachnospiraceae bacterium]
MNLENLYHLEYIVVLVFMALLLFACLLRAVLGPRVTDRVVAVNMMGTMVMVMIAVFAMLLGEGYLVDICLIYAMISFLAVIVLVKVYTGVYLEGKQEGKKDGSRKEDSKDA